MPEPSVEQFRRATARYATGIAVVTTIEADHLSFFGTSGSLPRPACR